MIRSKKKIKQALLRRAFDENRGSEMIAEIQIRTDKIRHDTKQHILSLSTERFVLDGLNEGQPRAVRFSNVMATFKKSDTRIREQGGHEHLTYLMGIMPKPE